MGNKNFAYNKKDGEIRNLLNYKSYNCSDDIDMQILCDDINLILQNMDYERKKAISKIDAIKDIVE